MKQIRSAFSLIELLVVISIIAVLASMLMPAIAMVREAALTTKCLSSLRQCVLAVNAYAGDNDGILPSGKNPSAWYPGPIAELPWPNLAHWHEIVRPYFSNGATTQKDVFWGCPKWKGRAANLGYTGYGMNCNPFALCTSSTWSPGAWNVAAPGDTDGIFDPTWTPVALAQVKFPSQRMCLGDSNDWYVDALWWQDPVSKWYSTGDPERHRNRMSTAMFDGSARFLASNIAKLSQNDPQRLP